MARTVSENLYNIRNGTGAQQSGGSGNHGRSKLAGGGNHVIVLSRSRRVGRYLLNGGRNRFRRRM